MRSGSLAFAICLVSLSTSAAPLGDKSSPPSLTAEDVLAKYIEAIGGARLQSVKSIVKRSETRDKTERRTSVMYRRAPDRYFHTTTTESTGLKFAAGFDGQTLWYLPPKPLEDWQYLSFAALLEETPIATEFRMRPYKKSKLLGLKKVGDRNAYAVELVQGAAEQTTYYIDSETFLLLRTDWSARYKMPIGNVPGKGFPVAGPLEKDIRGAYLRTTMTYYLDWRAVNGVRLPFEVRSSGDFHGTSQHGSTFDRGEVVTTVLEYQIDVPVDESVFAPPLASIKETLK